jgi:hypothetical protein
MSQLGIRGALLETGDTPGPATRGFGDAPRPR